MYMHHPSKRLVPEDKILVSSVYHITASSVLYSSILSHLRNHVKKIFPIDFFKSEYIQNSLYSISNTHTSDDNSFTQERPNLSILMQTNIEDTSFSGDDFLINNIFISRAKWLQPSIYTRLLWERNKGLFLTGSPTRTKNQFDITLTLNSELQAINVLNYLRTKIGVNRPVYLNRRPIELPIPPSIVGTIAAARGYDLSKLEDFHAVNKLIRESSDGAITFKRHNASGKYLYFIKYYTNLLTTMTSLDSIDKENVDKTLVKSSIKFTITMEYDSFSAIHLESYQNLPKIDYTKLNTYVAEDMGVGVILHGTFATPISSQLPNGHKVAFSEDIVTDINTTIDITNFKDIMGSNHLKFIQYLVENNLTDTHLTPVVYQNTEELEYGTDYTINWTTMELKLLYPRSNYDYKFIVYMDMHKANEYLESIRNPRNI